MLTKFRILYPQGSIVGELVTINHGQYIVRVLIKAGSVTLGTGLAGANTIEEAEDIARNRALKLLKLDSVSITESDKSILFYTAGYIAKSSLIPIAAENENIDLRNSSEFLDLVNPI